MNNESVKLQEEIKQKFPEANIFQHNQRRLYITIPKEKIVDIAKFLFLDKGLRLSIATGIDTRDGFEIMYHFSYDKIGTYFTIKTFVSKDNPKIQSLATFYPAANWIEREIHELLGVDFEGHPNLLPLLTAEDWPKDKYPLRRDYE